jgi:hypothetical protein
MPHPVVKLQGLFLRKDCEKMNFIAYIFPVPRYTELGEFVNTFPGMKIRIY